MRGYTKSDIKFHKAEVGSQSFPAINVKDHSYYNPDRVAEALDCTPEAAHCAIETAIELIREDFWRIFAEAACDIKLHPHFGKYAYIESAGRSAGWLIVRGIGDQYDVEHYWNAIDLTAWYSFEQAIKDKIKEITGFDYMVNFIRNTNLHIKCATSAQEFGNL